MDKPQEMNFITSTTINTAIIAFTLLIAVFLVTSKVDQIVTMKGVDECGKMSRVEKQLTTENTKVSSPITDIYTTCLKDKGIKK